MIKSFEKLKVRIDQNLNRAEKSEALAEDVVKIENKVACLKQVCQTVVKKLSDGVTSSSVKGNDGPAVEKRIRKTCEFALGQTLQENGRAYAQHEKPGGAAAMSAVLVQAGLLLNDLASSRVQYEIGVEKLIVHSLAAVLDDHAPPIARERKSLSNLLLEYDAAKSKLSRVKGGDDEDDERREDKLTSELADVESRLNYSRDTVETLMLNFLSREREVGEVMLVRYLELLRDHHERTARRISGQVRDFKSKLAASAVSPTFGRDLSSGIRSSSSSSSRIAFPLRLCVVRILQLEGLREEGLFRVAPPGLKIRRLAALVDAAECTDDDASHANDVDDPHVFAGLLKMYLRQLPRPLMCEAAGDMYGEWLSACSCSTTDRKGAIDALLHTLPDDHRLNLRYLMAFLHRVQLHSDVNKMTASNLAIVMAPNLIWTSAATTTDDQFAGTNVINDIVESLIADFHYYFGDVQQVQLLKDPPCLIGRRNSGFRYKNSTAMLAAAAKNQDRDELEEGGGGGDSLPPTPKPLQRTPVPKPRCLRTKTNPPPPPRPAERPSIAAAAAVVHDEGRQRQQSCSGGGNDTKL